MRAALFTTRAPEIAPLPSTDNRWLAYATNASGRDEIRVADLADMTTSVQVTTNGGIPLRWNSDGSRLFYDGGTISVAEVGRTGPVLASKRRAFTLPPEVRGRVDVMPDGGRALFVRGGLMHSDLVVAQRLLAR